MSNPARKLADAAYSLWCHDYNQLMHLGRYLSRGEPDANIRFPGIREAMTRSSEVGAFEEVFDDDEGALEDGEEAAADSLEAGEDPNAAA